MIQDNSVPSYESNEGTDLRKILQSRSYLIAERWFHALVPNLSDQLISTTDLRMLVDQMITLLCTESFDTIQANLLGAKLINMGLSCPSVITSLQNILREELIINLNSTKTTTMQQRLPLLLNTLAKSLGTHLNHSIHIEHEQIHKTISAPHIQQHQQFQAIERRYQKIVNTAPLVVFALDHKGIFTCLEGKVFKHLGLDPLVYIGRSIYDAMRYFPDVLENIDDALNGKSFMAVVEVRGRLFETYYEPQYDETNAVVSIEGVGLDVTTVVQLRERVEATPNFRPAALEHDAPTSINLTRNELVTLQYVAQGNTNKQIGLHLGVSRKTVEKWLAIVFEKLGVQSRTEAAALAVQMGLVNIKP